MKKSTNFMKYIPLVEIEKLAKQHPELVTKSPLQLWKEYITDDMLEKICENILLYARRDKINSKFDIAFGELLRFLGIISLSVYHSLPSEQDFWSNQSDLGFSIVSEALSSKLFLQMKSMFHLVDNHTLDGNNDEMAKVALHDSFNESFVKYVKYVDESMDPYFGHYSYKMFIWSKSIRFGYKIWCLCGLSRSFTIYTGKGENSSGPLGSRVVNEKSKCNIAEHSDPLKHELLFFDFFKIYNLLADLAAKNLKVIGTIRENRTLGASNKMKSLKEMKIRQRDIRLS